MYLCKQEEPPSPFIYNSNRASEPIKIIVKFNGGLRYAPPKNKKYEKKCPTCGNMIEAKVRHEYVAGILEEQIVFECPCGYFGVARPH